MKTELFKGAQDKGDNIKSIFQMTYCYTSLYHAYLCDKLQCHLFINVKNERGQVIAPFIWMNHNRTMANLNLERGDVIVLEAYAEKYTYGNEYHPLNVYRGKYKTWRLLYPSKAMKIGKELIEEAKVLNLSNLKLYDTFNDYAESMKIINIENYFYDLIHLVDNTLIENIFNRRGNVISKDYAIRCIPINCWLALTDEQRTKVLDNRKYTYTQILEYQEMMKNI